MRKCLWCLPVVLLGGTVTWSQQSAQTDNEKNLDAVLHHWEKAMNGISSLQAQIKRITVDPVFESTEVMEGDAKFVTAAQKGQSSRASVFLKKKNNPKEFEKIIISGNYLYQFAPQSKAVYVHEMPPQGPGQVGDKSILGFVFGMTAKAAKKRYEMTYVPPKDPHYFYIHVKPKLQKDKADFAEARLVLWRKNFLPRQLWFREPNGKEVTWDFPTIETGVRIPATDFAAPRLPEGWRLIRADKQKAPPLQPPKK